MTPEDLNDHAKVILLLCGHFGRESRPADGSPPLGTADYGSFSSFLHDKGLRPASLLADGVLDDLEEGMSPVDIPRIRALVARGAAMSFAVESWLNKGLWVLCRSDPAYPQRLKRQLRGLAPPILYGAGDQTLLERGGLAIVGSRKIGPEEEDFASRVATRCACDGVQVVSGGARGVDQTAMREALDAGGAVVGALADSLLKRSLQKVHREALYDRCLVLVSTTHPETGFNVGAAMARNKLIYALADHALVVQAEFKKGGTWSGAVEELKRTNGRTVFLHTGFSPKKVVDALQAMGALPFPDLVPESSLDLILKEAVAAAQAVRASADSQQWTEGELRLREDPPEAATPHPYSAPRPDKDPPVPPPSNPIPPAGPPATAFDAVWPLLRSHLTKPIKPADLAKALAVRKVQADDWIKQAHDAGLVRKLTKPVRHVLENNGGLELK